MLRHGILVICALQTEDSPGPQSATNMIFDILGWTDVGRGSHSTAVEGQPLSYMHVARNDNRVC